jgi:hypothetical protein
MGEISKYDEFGQSIIETVKRFNLNKILEIGSWDGTGSTQCFIEGMRDLVSPKLVCIEPNTDRFKLLQKNVEHYKWVETHNITSISYDKLLHKNFDDIWSSPYNNIIKDDDVNKKDIVKNWFDNDIETIIKHEKGFLDDDITLWDGVLIDGSEFTGYSEFILLKNRVKVLFLDDYYQAFKTRQIAFELEKSGEWQVLAANKKLRNGFAILIKK